MELPSNPCPMEVNVITHTAVRACLLLSVAMTAMGCSSQENLNKCRSNDSDSKIAGCTALIQAGKGTPESLSTFYNNRGTAYDDKHDYTHAIPDYDEAIRLNPNLASAFYGRGEAYDHTGEFDRAIQDYNEALRLNPNFAYAYDARGRAHRNKGDFDQAIRDYGEAIRLDPHYALAFNNRGDSYRSKGDYDQALQDFNEAIRLNPKLISAYANRGFVYLSLSNLAAATTDYEHVIAASPSSNGAVVGALELHVAMKRQGLDDTKLLAQVAATADLSKWPGPILKLDLGQMTADELMATAANASAEKQKWEICEANYFTGEDALFHHQRAKAIERLRAARDGCPKAQGSYGQAVAELKRLGVSAFPN
jgi:tetratricopeptide (TPR) repeat protein